MVENIFENRFMHAAGAHAGMGADIDIDGGTAVVHGNGVTGLDRGHRHGHRPPGERVPGPRRPGRRAGQTEMLRLYHLDRGYENGVEAKLRAVWGLPRLQRVPDDVRRRPRRARCSKSRQG